MTQPYRLPSGMPYVKIIYQHRENEPLAVVSSRKENEYDIKYGTPAGHPVSHVGCQKLRFHSGDIKEGLIGIINEQLIAVLVHRLLELDVKVPCQENKEAIACLKQANHWLCKRAGTFDALNIPGDGPHQD